MSIYLIFFKSLVFSIFLYDLKNIFILSFIFFEPKRIVIPDDNKTDKDLILFSLISTILSFILFFNKLSEKKEKYLNKAWLLLFLEFNLGKFLLTFLTKNISPLLFI